MKLLAITAMTLTLALAGCNNRSDCERIADQVMEQAERRSGRRTEAEFLRLQALGACATGYNEALEYYTGEAFRH